MLRHLFDNVVFPEIESEHTSEHSEDEKTIFAHPPRPQYKRQLSTASRFVEDLPSPPLSMRPGTPPRAATISFSSRPPGLTVPVSLPFSVPHSHSQPPPVNFSPPQPHPFARHATMPAHLAREIRPMSSFSSDFVMVEEPEEFDIPRAEWDLPRIPSGSLGFPSTVDLSRPDWAERPPSSNVSSGLSKSASARVTATPSLGSTLSSASTAAGTIFSTNTYMTSTTSPPRRRRAGTLAPASPLSPQLSAEGVLPLPRPDADAVIELHERIGTRVGAAAENLFDKARSTAVLVGDGTYPGFVLACARQVPEAVVPSKTARYPYGHLVYFQTSSTVHKRYAEIMPGDVIALQNALFKGSKGLQSYTEEYGSRGEPVVGVIGEYEQRKTKVRVYQANQHVGCQVGSVISSLHVGISTDFAPQTVEYVSYRFEDLKSGTIKARPSSLPTATSGISLIFPNRSSECQIHD